MGWGRVGMGRRGEDGGGVGMGKGGDGGRGGYRLLMYGGSHKGLSLLLHLLESRALLVRAFC